MTADEESEIIRENSERPESQQAHPFEPAEWTHPNGHPRCINCGGEERIGGECDPQEHTLAHTAAATKPKKLIGEANLATIIMVGRRFLDTFLHGLGAAVTAQWGYERTNLETLWVDGSIRDAVVYFTGAIKAAGRDMRFNVTVPVVIRDGKLQDPAVFRWAHTTSVFTKEAVEKLFRGMVFPKPAPPRDYMFGPIPEPGVLPPSRTAPDFFTGLR